MLVWPPPVMRLEPSSWPVGTCSVSIAGFMKRPPPPPSSPTLLETVLVFASSPPLKRSRWLYKAALEEPSKLELPVLALLLAIWLMLLLFPWLLIAWPEANELPAVRFDGSLFPRMDERLVYLALVEADPVSGL